MRALLKAKEREYKRSDGGLFIPSVKPGDVVLVDKPGSRDVKVYDAAEHAYERVPKVELEVKGKKVCTCPMRDILVGGCKCGGV